MKISDSAFSGLNLSALLASGGATARSVNVLEGARIRDAFNLVTSLRDAVTALGARLGRVKRGAPAGARPVSLRSDDLGLRHLAADVVESGEAINSEGGVFDASRAFDGSAGDPGFDAGVSVEDGRFSLNGKLIQVFSDDSLDDVMSRINRSAAGVIAALSEDGQRLSLRAREADTAVVIGGDDSGLLAAVKLDGVVSSRFSERVGTEGVAVSHPATLDPSEGVFEGPSTATMQLSGSYTGAADDALTFRVVQGGQVGDEASGLVVDVLDQQGVQVDRLEIPAGTPAGTELSLSNGLSAALSDGQLVAGDSFTVGVTAAWSEPFDAHSPAALAALGVGRGSFEVGGVEIEVLNNDSLDDVLTRINQYAGDVAAGWDEDREAVVLRRLSAGPLDIELGADSSGLLDALGLADGGTTLGHDAQEVSDADRPIDQVAALGAMRSGSMQINGVPISVDIHSDSLSDLISRISASGAGVDASWSSDGERVLLAPSDPAASLELDGGQTRFFDAIGVTPGVHAPRPVKGKVSARGSARAMEDMVKVINQVFEAARTSHSSVFKAMADDIGQLFDDVFSRSSLKPASLGLHFDLSRDGGPFRFWQRDQVRFRQALRKHPERFRELFLDKHADAPDGLVEAILDKVNAAARSLASQGDGKGLNLDLTA